MAGGGVEGDRTRNSSLLGGSRLVCSRGGDALPPTPWCPTLQQIMGANGLAAYEESPIDDLLVDLVAALDE
jgi:hypothetical protein